MPDDPRVQQLLDELLDADATPEAVCGSYPELLPQVRQRWRQICRARAELDAIFPPDPGTDSGRPSTLSGDTSLPAIPGYEVETVLGVGGMGVVFRARQVRLNRVVALKMALAGAYAGPHERERFQREAEAVAALRHPNVVQIFDVGESDGRPYFTMEFVEGGNLAQKLAGTPQPAREAAALASTLAGAVEAAHRAGIVHRDLKPANVLLTADGSPKVSDFGLARRLGGEAGLTRSGLALGTPSYMAPEQARGKADAVGTAADIYALGAILYELLTGRPPFRAETAAETVHQVVNQDPVPPSRLNGKVPRDLETIGLKCLRKEPQHRYATAAALADDLGRFLRGEAISARPEGRLPRMARRVRRRPFLWAAVALATLSTLALVAGGVWTYSERKATARAVEVAERAAENDLTEMAALLRKSAWPEAKAALERARGRLGDAPPPELRHRLERGTRDLKLGLELDAICINGAEIIDDSFAFARADKECEAAFREAGFGQVHDPAEAVAGRIAESDIANALVDALDHWAIRVEEWDPHRQAWLLSVSREVVKRRPDHDPTGWRDRARNPDVWKAAGAFDNLIAETRFDEQSVPLLLAVAQHLRDRTKNPLPYMRRIQAAHADDFWANYCLARVLYYAREYGEALRFFQAAAAVRKDSEAALGMIGSVLTRLERHEEAVEHFRHLLRVAPTPRSHRRLGMAQAVRGPYPEAVEHCRLALPHYPDDPFLLEQYGAALVAVGGRDDEALAILRKAVGLDGNRANAHFAMRHVYMRQSRAAEALASWRKGLDCASLPPDHKLWYGYAEYRLFFGDGEEYRRARTALLKTFGGTTDPYVAERTARASLLMPASGDELKLAVALADRAMAADRRNYSAVIPHFTFVKALADYRQGRHEQSIAALRGDASRMTGPSPRLVLAMALHRSGQESEARKTLALAVASHDWRGTKVRDQDGCIAHVLRREAEGMILTNLPAFLSGKHQPKDNDERLALIGVCQSVNRHRATAGLYVDAFAAAPTLADDVRAGHRFKAACAAAMAGCGRGGDAPKLGEPEAAKWRKQAREWLRAELAGWGKAVEVSTFPSTRDRARRTLAEWQTDPDLAGVREPAELDKLPAAERKGWRALWDEVAAAVKRYAPAQ